MLQYNIIIASLLSILRVRYGAAHAPNVAIPSSYAGVVLLIK